MWDYICPRCRREVAKNSHKCPYCGERFPFPLKIPPRCLKDSKALEDYVHKHVFPKVSAWQREYLAQFFTIIFQSGFETGDFSEWSGTVGSPSIVTLPVHHGNYAMQASGGGYTDSYAYKNIEAGYTTIYTRAYVRWPTNPTIGNALDCIVCLKGQYIWLAAGGIQNDGGTIKWRLTYRNAGANYYVLADSPNPTTDTWYCVEVKCTLSSTAGEARLYVDGTEIIAVTGLNNAEEAYIRHVRVGQYAWTVYPLFTYTVYVDCVVVADTYIGPEGVTVTVTDSVGLSDVALCHKTFAVADSVGLTDVPLKSWTPTVTDVFNLLDAVLSHKQLRVSDTVSLADVALALKTLKISDQIGLLDMVLRNKFMTLSDQISLADVPRTDKQLIVTDASQLSDVVLTLKTLLVADVITLADFVTVSFGVLVQVFDAVGLVDAAKIDKSLAVQDVLTLLDEIIRNKQLTITDVVSTIEAVAVGKLLTITDNISLTDLAKVLKQLRVSDSVSLVDAVQVPFRILAVIDSVGLTDTCQIGKALIITDQIALVEAVYTGKGKRAKIFLILGNMVVDLATGQVEFAL